MKLKGITDRALKRIAQAMGEEECPCKEMLKEEFGIDMDEFEDRLEGGLGDKAKPSDFPLDQVRMGVEVEMEHTDDPYIALEIVLDHLTEDDAYYTALDEMEEALEEGVYD